jgi:hypothetical protein
MTILFWTFLVSLLFAISIVLYRGYEVSSGKEIFSKQKREKADEFTELKLRKMWILHRRMHKKTTDFFKSLPDHFHIHSHKIWTKFSAKVDRYFDRLKSRYGAGKRGIISVYSHEITKKD